jgi:hypothetical protein
LWKQKENYLVLKLELKIIKYLYSKSYFFNIFKYFSPFKTFFFLFRRGYIWIKKSKQTKIKTSTNFPDILEKLCLQNSTHIRDLQTLIVGFKILHADSAKKGFFKTIIRLRNQHLYILFSDHFNTLH